MSEQRSELERSRVHARERVAALEEDLRALFAASASANLDDEHNPEGATVAFERAQLTAILDATRRQVVDLTAALTRLDAGTYGQCESCGRLIDSRRLEARPTATTCIDCARR